MQPLTRLAVAHAALNSLRKREAHMTQQTLSRTRYLLADARDTELRVARVLAEQRAKDLTRR